MRYGSVCTGIVADVVAQYRVNPDSHHTTGDRHGREPRQTAGAGMSMTAEERANKVVREYYLEGPPGRRWGVLIAAAIRAAEQEARAELMEEFRLAEKQALAAAKADADQRGAERACEEMARFLEEQAVWIRADHRAKLAAAIRAMVARAKQQERAG